jgi:hypothetical protein
VSRADPGATADEDTQRRYFDWLALVRDRTSSGGDALDQGCGNGIPAAKWLSDNGFASPGLAIDDERLVSEGTDGHRLFVATFTS